MQADPYVSSNATSLGSNRAGSLPVRILFSREGGSQRTGCKDPDTEISPCASWMGKHAYQAHFDRKIYQWEHICLVSIISRVPSMVVMLHVSDRGPDLGQMPPLLYHPLINAFLIFSGECQNQPKTMWVNHLIALEKCLLSVNNACPHRWLFFIPKVPHTPWWFPS